MIFGKSEPGAISSHLYPRALSLDIQSAIKGNPGKQNYSVWPRHWYYNARMLCETCGQEFIWLAEEQKAWFEEYGFWIDSVPRRCKTCQSQRKLLINLRKEYDTTVNYALHSGTVDEKQRIIDIVRILHDAPIEIPRKMMATQQLLERQIIKLRSSASTKPNQ